MAAQEPAARLGAERRRVYLASLVVALLAPIVPYLTGTWETVWFALDAWLLPLAVKTGLFLVGFQVLLAVVSLPLAFYSGYVVPRAFGLGRQSRRAWLLDWCKASALLAIFGRAAFWPSNTARPRG